MKVIILGASGMLGSQLFYDLSKNPSLRIFGSVRTKSKIKDFFPTVMQSFLIDGIDINDLTLLSSFLKSESPDVVINCIGLIRQQKNGQDALPCIDLNARFPHLLNQLCTSLNARVIHYSTDCVFDGHKGQPYTEDDAATAKDMYGLTKFIGELHSTNAVTIRTSIIGHELSSNISLIDWFLSQNGEISGFTKAIYSGLPTHEHSKILEKYILQNHELHGLYQVSGTPISKFDLLNIVKDVYEKDIRINPSDRVSENKTLSFQKFSSKTGYRPKSWNKLVEDLHTSYRERFKK